MTQFTLHEHIYAPHDILKVIEMSKIAKCFKGNSKGVYSCNVPCSFDIETSSFYVLDGSAYTYEQLTTEQQERAEKAATMYVWQFGINGYCIVGRTWNELAEMCKTLSNALQLNDKRKLIVYVHNLSYEFQFIRKHFMWDKVFATSERTPIYALTSLGIEFRCSYVLSGYSLDLLGKNLTKYPCRKLRGFLDYSLIRHARTPLTDKEMQYCVNDIKVVMCYIQEMIEKYRNISSIPLTKTGCVRKYIRSVTLKHKGKNGKQVTNYKYVDTIRNSQIIDVPELYALKRAFCGGFTHANADRVRQTIDNVHSYDFTSSYPYVMVSEEYPVGTAIKVIPHDIDEVDKLCREYCCIMDIELTDIFSTAPDDYISVSKCIVKESVADNNGRISAAKRVVLTVTNIDFAVIRKCYQIGQIRVGTMYCYKKSYLPTDFVAAIMHLYADKTTLKGISGKESEYLNAKEMLNSCYGMCVTDILRDTIDYSNDCWSTISVDAVHDVLHQYNESSNRFLFYPWGVFVTAYARRNLFTAILSLGDDYIYADTDSVKFTNLDAHKKYFEAYNARVLARLEFVAKYHKLDIALFAPCTLKKVSKPIGIWDYEGCYTHFKTLGAKRYMVEHENALNVDGKQYKYSLTVSGVNKMSAIPYLCSLGETPFDWFDDGIVIPPSACGKNLHTYIDTPIYGTVPDYNGVIGTYEELSCTHLSPTSYSLSLSKLYIDYLLNIQKIKS